MLTLKLAGYVTSDMVDTFLRRQLLLNHLIVKLAVMKGKRFYHGEIHFYGKLKVILIMIFILLK